MANVVIGIFIFFTMIVSATAQNYTEEWHDVKRNRTVPVRIFLPNGKNDVPPCPVVLLSHGLGGNRDGFGYLGEHWSRHDYIVVAMQHPGSDILMFKDRKPGENPREIMRKNVTSQNVQDRYDDVLFVLDELGERLPGKVDPRRIGIGGHSFGSQTTLAAIGRLPYKADARLKAAVVFSPNQTKIGDQRRVHAPIKTPVFHLTGTKDDSPLEANFDPDNRQIPFRSIDGPDQYLVVFKGGNHMLFSGHPRPFGLSKIEEKYQPKVAEATRKFFDAYLKDDEDAKIWLQKNGLFDWIGDDGTVEIKTKKEIIKERRNALRG